MNRLTKGLVFSFLTMMAPAAMADDPYPVAPVPPKPEIPDPNPREYVGVGSTIAYSRSGVVEVGGAMSLSAANNFTSFSADPMIGYFIINNLELSGILGFQSFAVDGADTQSRFSLLVEPSFHYPFTNEVFGAIGWGGGIALLSGNPEGGTDVGFAMVPRAGFQFLVGRSGLLNFGVRYVMMFTDVDTNSTAFEGRSVLSFENSFDVTIGYTAMF